MHHSAAFRPSSLPPLPARSIAGAFRANFALYLQHIDRIDDILGRAEGLLRASGDPDIAGIGGVRWELSRAVREYKLFKHVMIFDPLTAAGGWRAGMARELKEECVRAGESYRDYLARWTAISILDRWLDYKPAALAFVARLRRHIEREKRRMEHLLSE